MSAEKQPYAPKLYIKKHNVTNLEDHCIRCLAMKSSTEGVFGLFEEAGKNSLAFYEPEDKTTISDAIQGTISDAIYHPVYDCYFVWVSETNSVFKVNMDRTVVKMEENLENVNYLSKAFQIYKDYLFINQERSWIVYNNLDAPEPTKREIPLKQENMVCFQWKVLSDDRILYMSINSKVGIVDWEGQHVFEYFTPRQDGFCREMAMSVDSNEMVINYTTRDAYRISLEWLRVSDDLNSVEVVGTYLEPEEEMEKYDRIFLQRSSRGNKLLLFALNCPEGEMDIFTLEDGQVVRCCAPVNFNQQYHFIGNTSPGEFWMVSRIGPIKQFIVR